MGTVSGVGALLSRPRATVLGVAAALVLLYASFGAVPAAAGIEGWRFFYAYPVFFGLVFLIYLQNLYRFGLVPDYSLKCRFCNGPVNRYSEFCEHCGADLIAEELLVPCPKCGIEVVDGTKFCPECGGKIVTRKPKRG